MRREVAELIDIKTWKKRTDLLIKQKSSLPVISSAEFDKWLTEEVKDLQLSGAEEIRRQLNTYGFIVDFSDEINLVIVEPQWLADMFKGVLSFQQEVIDGLLSKDQLIKRWTQVKKQHLSVCLTCKLFLTL